jgi:hypothetical protein
LRKPKTSMNSATDFRMYLIGKNEDLIKLLADLFPTGLTNNEIKAASIPFQYHL